MGGVSSLPSRIAVLRFCYSGGVGSTWVLAGDCLRLAFFPSSVHTGAHNAGNKITLDRKASDVAGVQGTASTSLRSVSTKGARVGNCSVRAHAECIKKDGRGDPAGEQSRVTTRRYVLAANGVNGGEGLWGVGGRGSKFRWQQVRSQPACLLD
ncbi:hypothetical protein LZ30DRAFT_270131 [Colletotrichum cereale]|nr:hypothetical protein LZ30DRAFT_270131 [Colletotrichum cereale]